MISGIGTSTRLLPEFALTTPTGATKTATGGGDFGTLLSSLAGSALDTLKQGEAAALQGVQGNMPVQQVVDRVLAAERTLQAGLAIRDKLVTAFLDISRMQI